MSITPVRGHAEKRAYLSEARIRLREKLPGVEWDQAVWDLRPLQDRAHRSATRRAYFCIYGSQTVPLPGSYAEVVKAWLVLTAHTISNFTQKLDSARILWDVLKRRGAPDEGFDFRDIRDEDLLQAEIRMGQIWATTSTHTQAKHLVSLATDLAARGICRHLGYEVQTPRPSDRDQDVLNIRPGTQDPRLPTHAALEGLADIYQIHAVSTEDRLLIATATLTFALGLRVGEILSLPEDCEVELDNKGRTTLGIRYFSEKQRGGSQLFDTYSCTDTQAELVRPVLAEIRTVTTPARIRARQLEADPSRVPLGLDPSALLTPSAAAELLGLRNASVLYRDKSLQRTSTVEGVRYRVSDLEAYLLARRVDRLWTVDLGDGRVQPLSESLFVVFQNFFHPGRGTNPQLVVPVTAQDVSDFVSGRTNAVRSAFERFDIREPDGSFCKVTTKQFRHFLNDVADRGGMSVDLLTRWFNRSHPKDTNAYRHKTPRERAYELKGAIRRGEVASPISDGYHSLPEEVRDDFLENQVVEVHFVGGGWCSHHWSVEPCPDHLNCLRGCKNYHRTIGDPVQRHALVQIKNNTEKALLAAQQASLSGDPERVRLTQTWIAHHEETIEGTRAALAVDDEFPAGVAGDLVPVFPDGPRNAVPMEGGL